MDRSLVPLVGVGSVVQNREETKVIFLCDRIIFVVVTLSASHRGSHPNSHRGVDSINHRNIPILLVACASLVISHRVAMKCSCD